MKIKDIQTIEQEVLNALKLRAMHNGDNHAAEVLLNHLRLVSKEIQHWRERKDSIEKKKQP